MNEVFILAMDDCKSEKINGKILVSLTGILIPVSENDSIRKSLYDVINPIINQKDTNGNNIIDFEIPEFHGVDFLRDKEDDIKLDTYNKLALIVKNKKLRIYRVSYYITKDNKEILEKNQGWLNLCWIGILKQLETLLEHNFIIPLMDGFNNPSMKKLSGFIRDTNTARMNGFDNDIIIKNTTNIIGEVFYADSSYSLIIQIVDIISYLRHVNDLKSEGKELSKFKHQVYLLNSILKECIQFDQIVEPNKKVVDRINGRIEPITENYHHATLLTKFNRL